MDCVFCQPAADHLRTNVESALFEARWDGHPLTEGHALVIPKRHVVSLFDLDRFEIQQVFAVLRSMRRVIGNEYGVEDFNIGVNDGTAAGRTVDHLHIHLIPRRLGDVEDPRGGIRNLMPGTVAGPVEQPMSGLYLAILAATAPLAAGERYSVERLSGPLDALRAVVERHKPELFGGFIACLGCSPGMPPPILIDSPCEELKLIAGKLGIEGAS